MNVISVTYAQDARPATAPQTGQKTSVSAHHK